MLTATPRLRNEVYYSIPTKVRQQPTTQIPGRKIMVACLLSVFHVLFNSSCHKSQLL